MFLSVLQKGSHRNSFLLDFLLLNGIFISLQDTIGNLKSFIKSWVERANCLLAAYVWQEVWIKKHNWLHITHGVARVTKLVCLSDTPIAYQLRAIVC